PQDPVSSSRNANARSEEQDSTQFFLHTCSFIQIPCFRTCLRFTIGELQKMSVTHQHSLTCPLLRFMTAPAWPQETTRARAWPPPIPILGWLNEACTSIGKVSLAPITNQICKSYNYKLES